MYSAPRKNDILIKFLKMSLEMSLEVSLEMALEKPVRSDEMVASGNRKSDSL